MPTGAGSSDDDANGLRRLGLSDGLAGPLLGQDVDLAVPSFCTALADALTQVLSPDGEPLRPEDLARATRADITVAVEGMLGSATFLDAVDSGQLAEELLLHLVKAGDAKLARNAIASGASVNCRTPDREGLTPLMLAAQGGHVEVVRVLLTAGASVDERSFPMGPPYTGSNRTPQMTALHFACAVMHEEVAVALIDAGASIEIKDIRNRTPLELTLGPAGPADSSVGIRRGFLDQSRPDRERMQERLVKYAHGCLPSSHLPTLPTFYGALTWSKERHARMPPVTREAVMLLLLHSQRAQPNEAGWLPPELWPCVFGSMRRDWIREPAPKPEPAPAPAPQTEPSAASQPPAPAASPEVARERCKIDEELKVVEESLRHIGLVTRGDPSLEREVASAVQLLKDKQSALEDRRRQVE